MGNSVAATNVRLKGADERHSVADGTTVLVDRLWPRGVKKTTAAIDHWEKDLAPSTESRKWFGHDPVRWKEFRRRCAMELRRQPDQIKKLRNLSRHGPVTLVYAAHHEQHSRQWCYDTFC
jgi:uncharacterized protein YeaO (DUF488 family)